MRAAESSPRFELCDAASTNDGRMIRTSVSLSMSMKPAQTLEERMVLAMESTDASCSADGLFGSWRSLPRALATGVSSSSSINLRGYRRRWCVHACVLQMWVVKAVVDAGVVVNQQQKHDVVRFLESMIGRPPTENNAQRGGTIRIARAICIHMYM